MPTSTFDLFKIGVGPSSSHTMGPMTAAADFASRIAALPVARVVVRLYGSLALTGKGHATDRAIVLGLAGHVPASIDPDVTDAEVAAIREQKRLKQTVVVRSDSTRKMTCSSSSASDSNSIPTR